MPIDLSLLEDDTSKKESSIDLSLLDDDSTRGNISKIDLSLAEDSEGPSFAKMGAGFVTDIAIGEVGRMAGAAAGTAIGTAIAGPLGTLPGFLIGYISAGLASGAAGSAIRQRIINPKAELDEGQVIADSLINLVPSFGVGKSVVKGVLAQGAIGAGISGGAEIIESIVNEDRMPTMDELARSGITGAALGAGLGIAGSTFSKSYEKFAGKPIDAFTAAFKANDPDAKIIYNGATISAKDFSDEVAKKYRELGINIREKYDDEFIRARLLQDMSAGGQLRQKDGKLKVKSDEMDYYLNRRLADAKIDANLDEVGELTRADSAFLLNKSDTIGVEPEELSQKINDYLHAKHAINYNAAHRKKFKGDGAAGITTRKAKDIVADFEGSGLSKELEFSISNRKLLSERILDTLKDGGLVSDNLYNKLRKDFPDYVPLNRVMDADETDEVRLALTGVGTRYESKGRGLFKAVGSERDAADINQNIVDNLAGAVRRAEINKANQSFLNLIKANKKASKDLGIKEYIPKNKFDIPSDRSALTVFENGEKKFITFTDQKLANVFKGRNKKELPALLQGTYAINRTLGGLYTRYSPEFWIPNKFRDISEAIVNNSNNMRMIDAIKVANPAASMNVIRKKLSGATASNPNEQRLFDLYDAFKKDGGSTGGLGLSTLKDLEKQLGELSGNLRMPVKSKIKKFNKAINDLNEIIEDSTRFDTYLGGLNSGMTSKQAAFAARNSSFDPRQRGSETDFLAATFLFANPAIQGGKNFLRSLKNPKVLGAVTGGLISTSYLLDKHNQSIDPDYKEKIPKWKLDKHLTIVTGKNEDGTLEYFSMPIGYSMAPLKMTADYAQDVLLGGREVDVVKDSTELASAFVNSYNPMGGSLVPTVLRPMTELASNEDGLGRDIRPSWLENKNMSSVEKIFPWTADTQGGELALSLAEQLEDMGYEVSPENLLYLYQNYTGGPGATVKRLLNLTSKMWNNQAINRDDVPIARRFFGKTFADTFEKRTGDRATIDNLEKQENTDSARSSRLAFQIEQRVKEAPASMKEFVLIDQLSSADEAVKRKVLKSLEDKAKGLTSIDRQAKNLTVAKRAEYYKEKISTLPPSQVQLYIQDQIEKGVMTPRVLEVMRDTESFKQFFGQ
tara:strand:- start:2 stop:3406 length:3405 start_codon:yes stop_codon:yes gene_type:complete